jgi:hypothetical protein
LAGFSDEKDGTVPNGTPGFVAHTEVVEERTTDNLELIRGADEPRTIPIAIPSIRHMFVPAWSIVLSCAGETVNHTRCQKWIARSYHPLHHKDSPTESIEDEASERVTCFNAPDVSVA